MGPRFSAAISLTVLLVASALGTPGCASGEETADADILRGTKSTKAQNAVVFIGPKHQGGDGNMYVESRCTGTLIAPKIVLTALHCLGTPQHHGYTGSSTRVGRSTCKNGIQSGEAGDYRLESPKNFVIKVGFDLRNAGYHPATGVFAMDKLAPEAFVKSFVLPKNQCSLGGDVAALILDRPITNAPIATVRTTTVRAGEKDFNAIGWGFTGDHMWDDNTLTRRQRGGLHVDTKGPKDFSDDIWDIDHRVAKTEFRLQEKGVTCFGDSGGAILDKTGALVGVISRGDDATCSKGLTIAGDATMYTALIKEAKTAADEP